MKKWIIPISWMVCGTLEIEADTLEDAYDIALDKDTPLPTNGEYIFGSDIIDYDIEDIREMYNDGREDDEDESV